MFRVIIAGGRDFNDYQRLCKTMDYLLKNKVPEVTIISGGARGADSLGERYANERGFSLIIMKADWEKYGKSAGIIRNKEMLSTADEVVCFWNRVSRGTGHMIKITKEIGKLPRVVYY